MTADAQQAPAEAPSIATATHDTRQLNSWLEISSTAYRSNLDLFRQLVGSKVELSAVVKANAYGHGLIEIARLAVDCGADSFCVHGLDEALAIRGAGLQQDVLIMGHVPLARLREAAMADFRLVLYNRRSAELLAALASEQQRRVRVHLKLETGTCRQGIGGEEVEPFLDLLARHPSLHLEGVYTHFADIEDTTSHEYAFAQLEAFERGLGRIRRRRGEEPLLAHAACSAAALLFPQTHFDMVRLGISQYGLWPSKETFLSYRLDHPREKAPTLRPVLSWKARISQIKEVPAGQSVGYGRTYQTTRRSRLAVLPIGYSDGYDRKLSNQAHVLIRGQRAPVRGRVCMNLTLVDVTDIPDVELEDEAVLIGRQGVEEISAARLAEWIGTIGYEVVARLSPALPRLVV